MLSKKNNEGSPHDPITDLPKPPFYKPAVELISSMRFAISLLLLIALASVIGSVVKQGEPYAAYVNQFGPFWADIFLKFHVYSMYSSPWFLLIMTFLVFSTLLCILRNTPKIFKDMHSWHEKVCEQSLLNFSNKAIWTDVRTPRALLPMMQTKLVRAGFSVKVLQKGFAHLIIGKKGYASKLGYFFAHIGIIIICLGGLMDSDLPIFLQEIFSGKTPYNGDGFLADIAPKHRLDSTNFSFRGNMIIPEESSRNAAIIRTKNGIFIQNLPFSVKLKKLIIEYYSSGMPKRFASNIEIFDYQNAKHLDATIEVNHPLVYKGIALYQSSFGDGGSKFLVQAYPMLGTTFSSFNIKGVVGEASTLDKDKNYTIEWTDFKLFNVENMAKETAQTKQRNISFESRFFQAIEKLQGSATNLNSQEFKNIGPSLSYKLRDKAGQARKYLTFMRPIMLNGYPVFISGMSKSADAPFYYLRIPADDEGSIKSWMRLRATLMNTNLRREAAFRYAQTMENSTNKNSSILRSELESTALKILDVFATNDQQSGGYIGIAKMLEKLPTADQENAASVFLKILHGSLWQLWQISREKSGLQIAEINQRHIFFMHLAATALSDTIFYDSPVYLTIDKYQQVQATGLEVSRSPGKFWVYFGSLLLVLGIFAMLYIQNCRIWIWIKETEEKTKLLLAASTQRRTLDFDQEFIKLQKSLEQE